MNPGIGGPAYVLVALLLAGCGADTAQDEGTQGSGATSPTAVADTSPPPLPDMGWSSPEDTTAFPVTYVPGGTIYYRTVAGVRFDTTASGTWVRAFLQDFGAVPIASPAGTGDYVVRFPDPGAAPDSLATKLEAMWAQRRVTLAYPLVYVRRFSTEGGTERHSTHVLPRLRDTAWEPPTDTLAFPVVRFGTAVLFRTLVGVRFVVDATETQIRELAGVLHADVVGRDRDDAWVLRIPDPGPSLPMLRLLLGQAMAEPSVEDARPMPYRLGIDFWRG